MKIQSVVGGKNLRVLFLYSLKNVAYTPINRRLSVLVVAFLASGVELDRVKHLMLIVNFAEYHL